MTILVTGGCGFIGSHLVSALLKSGQSVRVVDDLSTGHRENIPPSVEFIQADVADTSAFTHALENVNAVFHLAAIASVERSNQDWFRTHQVNSGGMVNLCDHIGRSKRRIPVVYASSAAVYGDCATLPIREDQAPAPLSAYGADKRACEHHGHIASNLHGIPTLGMRFFNVFGPGQDPKSPYSGVISLFMDRAAKRQNLTILGDGKQTRDFVYVEDVVDALQKGMEALLAGMLQGQVFNVGTGCAISIQALAESVCDIYGLDKATYITHADARVGEIRHSLSDISAIQKDLGFSPKWDVVSGLRQMKQCEAA